MAKKQRRAKPSRPPSRSPKRAATSAAHEEEDIDGCGVEFHEHAATPDEHLPPSRGGVEEVRRARRR